MDIHQIGADKPLEEISFNEDGLRGRSAKARYMAEQEQHLLKVSAKKATDSYNIRIIFFPIIVAVLIGLLFYSVDVSKGGGKMKNGGSSKRSFGGRGASRQASEEKGREDRSAHHHGEDSGAAHRSESKSASLSENGEI